MLPDTSRNTLLDIARKTVEAVVAGRPAPEFEVDDEALQGHQGAFVTLRTHGNLRGCIGCFVAQEPLWQVVRRMAVQSATEDPRFSANRLRPQDMADLEVEISVLSPLKRIKDADTEFQLGKHGIYVRQGFRSGCFLPQVALETGWSKEEFLAHCCAGKAGLPPDAWKDPSTELYTFTAEILEET